MGKRKQKKNPTGKDILAMQLGQTFADVVLKSLYKYSHKMGQASDGTPAIIINNGAGNFATVSDDTVEIFETIKTPVAIIKEVAGNDELAWRVWRLLQVHGEKVAKGLCPALLMENLQGEFVAIDSDE